MAHQWKNYTVGVCYYPEHWPEEMWESDLTRMLAAGITVVMAVLAFKKVHPIIIICISAVLGIIFGYLGLLG